MGCSVAGSALGLFIGALAGLVMPDLFTTWLGFVAVVAFNGFLGHALLKSVHAAEHVLPPPHSVGHDSTCRSKQYQPHGGNWHFLVNPA